MKYRVFFLGLISFLLYSGSLEAKTTFLPDWMGDRFNFSEAEFGVNYDDPMCEETGLYHQASGCPSPKIFDEYCPYDDEWISDCHCPDYFNKTCQSPYRGDTRIKHNGYASCDDLWVACCDTTCPSGTTKNNPGGCGGHTYNDCGDICYYPYEECCTPLEDETNCEHGTETCSDGCEGTRTCCKGCTPKADVDENTCEYGTETCSDGCGGTRTCCKECTPQASVDETDCENGTEDCDDGCGGTRKCCKSAPTCLSDETDCENGTEDCDDGCGGTRKCCKSAPTCLSDETDCENGTEDCDNGCGGTRKCCKGCTPSANETNCSYGTKDCDDGCGGTRTCCKTCADNGGAETCSGESSADKCANGYSSTCTDCNGNTKYVCKATADCVEGGSATCSGKSKKSDCTYGSSSSCKTCDGTTLYICDECSDSCETGTTSNSCTSPKTASESGKTECGTQCYTCSCPSDYKYSCSGTGYKSGSGTACDSKYKSCECSDGYEWKDGVCKEKCSDTCKTGTTSNSCTSPKTASESGKTECGTQCYTCSCPSDYKYSCSGTGYKSGSGTACDSKYKSCECSDGYEWKDGVCKEKEKEEDNDDATDCGENEELKNGVCQCIKDYIKVSGVCKDNRCTTNNGQNETCPDGSKASKAYTNSAGNPCYHCSTNSQPSPSSCTYTNTKESCASSCKNVGTESCTKNGTTYYKSCGTSKCLGGQSCCSGTCRTFKGCSAPSSDYVAYPDGPYDPVAYCHSRGHDYVSVHDVCCGGTTRCYTCKKKDSSKTCKSSETAITCLGNKWCCYSSFVQCGNGPLNGTPVLNSNTNTSANCYRL